MGNTIFRKRKNNPDINTKSLLASGAGDWQVLHTEPTEKWRKFADGYGFSYLTVCNKKSDVISKIRWNTAMCVELNHESEKCALTYSKHTDIKRHFSYKDDDMMREVLSQATLLGAIPNSKDYVCFLFRVGGVNLLYARRDSTDLGIIFFVHKSKASACCQCEISPDESKLCLVFPNTKKAARQDNDEGLEHLYDIQVYSRRPAAFEPEFRGNMFELDHEVPRVRGSCDAPKLLFDPRYYSSRLCLVNVTNIQENEVIGYIAFYNTGMKRLSYCLTDCGLPKYARNEFLDAAFSPDGAYIAVLSIWVTSPGITAFNLTRAVMVFDSDSGQLCRTLFIGTDHLNECSVNYMPMFSPNGRHMILRKRKFVKVLKMPLPSTLKGLCRLALWHAVKRNDLARLPLPFPLLQFLQFKPYL